MCIRDSKKNPKRSKRREAAAAAAEEEASNTYYSAIALRPSLTLAFTFFLTFDNCIVSVEFLPWEIWVAFPGEKQL